MILTASVTRIPRRMNRFAPALFVAAALGCSQTPLVVLEPHATNSEAQHERADLQRTAEEIRTALASMPKLPPKSQDDVESVRSDRARREELQRILAEVDRRIASKEGLNKCMVLA